MISAPAARAAHSAPSGSRHRLARVLRFPLVRIVLATLVVSAAMNAARAALKAAGLSSERGVPHRLALTLLGTCATIAVVHAAYLTYVRYLEGRPASELAATGATRELALGAIIGAALFSTAIAVLFAGGWYRVAGTNPWTAALTPLLAAAAAAYLEELIARGILFRNLEELLGSWLALTVTALLFGLAHLANPNATIVGALAIALEAGVLLGAAYMATRRLWLAMGIHFAWNFVQGGIFGMAVSGSTSRGILRGELHGPTPLTGGAFGVEGSVVAVVVCLAATVPLIAIARREGNVLAPLWRRRPTMADVPQLRTTAIFNSASAADGGESP